MTLAIPGRDLLLTDEQRAAVEWGEGPLMVLAGAGTGKTTVVVERVRHLLATDPTVAPENILVLTYNVRAAAELTRRLEQTLGLERASRLWVHNFHSFGHRLLTAHRAELGLASDAGILDQVGQRLVLRDLRPQLGHFLYHDLSLNPNPVLGRFADTISRAKDELVTPDEFAAFAEARRTAFVFEHGLDAWEEAVESIRRRRAASTLDPIWEVRRGLRESPQEGIKLADRAARRTAGGINYALPWHELTPAQQDLAEGLKPTYLRDAAAFEVLRLEEVAQVYALYQQTLHERGLVDFGEQQLRAIELLRDHPNLLLRYQRQFRHVLVDEFQDANMAQILLLELVGRGPDKPDNVVVVGDDDQSIYRFRGASYAAFSQFEARFARPPAWAPDRPTPPVVSLPLLGNRRSTGNILAAANRLIEHNVARLKSGQSLRGIKDDGARVEVAYARDDADEADLIVDRLREAFEELPARIATPDGADRPKRWSDLVVLYRRHRHREVIVDRLRRAGIPYTLIGGTGLFLQPEIRDLEAALRVCANPADDIAFTRLLTAGPWRFDAGEILLLTRAAAWDRRAVFTAAAESHCAASAETAPAPALRAKLTQLFATLDDLVPRAMREGPFTILEEYLVRTNLLHDLIAVETPDAQRTVLAIARLMRFASDWQREHPRQSLGDFVAWLDLYQEIGGDLDTDAAPGVSTDGVALMTIYQAKGLEYEVVVVPRLVEREFPDTREENLLIPVELLKQRPPDEFSIAEERRLLFVAMTRARRRLLLTAIEAPAAQVRPEPVRRRGRARGRPWAGARRRPGDPTHARARARRRGGRRADGRRCRRGVDAVARTADAGAGGVRTAVRAAPAGGRADRRARAGGGGRGGPDRAHRRAGDRRARRSRRGRRGAPERRRPRDVAGRLAAFAGGLALLQIAPLPSAFSYSSLHTYAECPLQFALSSVYGLRVDDRKGYFEFGSHRPRGVRRVHERASGCAGGRPAVARVRGAEGEVRRRLPSARLHRRGGRRALLAPARSRCCDGSSSASWRRRRRRSRSSRASSSSSTVGRGSRWSVCAASSTASTATPTARSR